MTGSSVPGAGPSSVSSVRGLRPAGAVGLLLAGHLGLLLAWDLPQRPAVVVAFWLIAFAGLAWAMRFGSGLKPLQILVVAALLRALMLPLPPTLSDDLYRYLWDGTVAAAGHNPYRLAPPAEPLSGLDARFRADHGRGAPHPEVPTIYPPVALAVFAIASKSPVPVLTLKSALAAADLAVCAMLLVLARRLRLPVIGAIGYAWNPLVTLEIAGMGHVDALGVLAATAAVGFLAVRPPRAFPAATAVAAGILAKLVPAVAMPLWARYSGRPWAFVATAAGLCAVGLVPVVVATGGIPPALGAYAAHWEFNGPLFEPLWRALAAAHAPDGARALLAELGRATGWDGWNAVYPYLHARFLARALLAGGLLAAVLWQLRRAGARAAQGLLATTLGTFGAVALCLPTFYPWYLLWVLPWSALAGRWEWLVLSATLLLSYLPQFTGVPYWPWVYVAIWGPFLVALTVRRRWSTSSSTA